MKKTTNVAERRATLLQAAAQVAHHVTSILEPADLLNKTVDVICDQFGFYYAGVFLLDQAGEWAVLRAGRGEAGAQMIAEGHCLKVGGQSMIGTAMAQRKALIALDVGKEPSHFDNPYLPLTRSEMALPLLLGDQAIGALTVQSTEEAAFSDDDTTALQAMADQLAIAIHNAVLHRQNHQLLAATERRARLLEAAAEVGHGVTSILDLDELLRKTVDIICDAYGFYFSCVYLMDEAGEWLILRAAHGKAGAAMLAAGHKLQVGGKSMNGTVAVTGKARIALNVDQDPVHLKNPHLPDTRSEMVMPLLVSGQIIGTLAVQSTEPAAFSEDDITTLQTMADQLAIAIHNARLLQELKAAHAEILRAKTFEAIATSTSEAVHWIGNKALPISTSVARLNLDLSRLPGAAADTLESMREDLDMIDNNARLIVSVQEHLIGPAREYQPQPVMVGDVIQDTATEMKIPASTIAYLISADAPLALADATQLSRAFSYVLQNALEAIEGAARQQITVQIEPSSDHKWVLVRIADSGPGIPPGDLEKVWATFYTTKGIQHAGLGLSATLQIVRQLEGQAAASNVPGGGAQVELSLPALEGNRIFPPKPGFSGGQSLLLVDDADAWSSFAQEALQDVGHAVVRTADLPGDLSSFDLILLDNMLKNADALAVLKQLEKAGASARTVVVASNLRVERAMLLMQFGVKDVILKPYTPSALAALVGRTD